VTAERTDARRRRRAKATLGAWLIALVALAVAGGDIEDRLRDTGLALPGTESHRAKALQDETFGHSVPVAILLEGPPADVERRAQRLALRLREQPDVRVLSPFDDASLRADLRPQPGRALIVADFDRDEEEAINDVVPTVERLVDETVTGPVEAHLTGLPFIAAGIKDASIEATRKAERITVPVLLLVLLLVFRSPVAAAIPLVLGATTVIASTGVIALLAAAMTIDSVIVPIASMMGLALGVDYALLVVSRFREEARRGVPLHEAVLVARQTAGRTILFAGAVLVVSMLIALTIAPGGLLLSVTGGVVVATVIGMLAGMTALPASLTLLGPHLERWSLPARTRGRSRAGALARRPLARPGVTAAVVVAVLLVVAVPALELDTGPIDVRQLPEGNQVREDFETIERTVGPGWAAPFVVVARAPQGPITEERRLRALARFEQRVANDPGVELVVGPGGLAAYARDLREVPQRLAEATRAVSRMQRVARADPRTARGFAASARALRRASRDLVQLRRASPRLFESGYSVLAALDGAQRPVRRRAAGVVNLDGGGDGARAIVIPKTAPNAARTRALARRLDDAARSLARATDTNAAVGGQAALLDDYDRVTSDRLPLLIAALIATAYVLLVPILRALLLPLIAVILNVLTVAAAFGVLALLFQAPDLPLGGPGHLDAISAAAIFTIVFGLSIDYQVFLLTRMREAYVETRSPDAAVAHGLARTASVVTGAALIMTAVFVTFATIDITNIRQMGVGLAFAIIIDATVVRLVLLPALMRALGSSAWWIPAWLDRVLPHLDPEAPATAPAQARDGALAR
jgi:putative drug exporter of the RND superfamily